MNVRDLFDLKGKVAIVTGGSRGLGLEIAEGLGEAGAAVAITARREQWLGTARERLTQLNVTHLAVQADISQAAQVEGFVRQTVERFSRVDILVNNAGITWGAPAEAMPLEKWEQVLAVNVTGAFLMSRAVFPFMSSHGGGAIVNVASVAGIVGTPAESMDAVGYSASKGALISLTRDLALKWARHGIRVNALAPGFFPTRMTEPLLKDHGDLVAKSVPFGRIGREGELKGAALFLASPAAAYVTGQVLAVDGGITAA